MAEIIDRYRDPIRGMTTVYKCDICGKPTKRLHAMTNRRILCGSCSREVEKQRIENRENAKIKDAFDRGEQFIIDKLKVLLNGSEDVSEGVRKLIADYDHATVNPYQE